MSCGVGCRLGLDLLLWFRRRLAATALIRPLAWEPPYATGSGPRKGKKTKKKNWGTAFMSIKTKSELGKKSEVRRTQKEAKT